MCPTHRQTNTQTRYVRRSAPHVLRKISLKWRERQNASNNTHSGSGVGSVPTPGSALGCYWIRPWLFLDPPLGVPGRTGEVSDAAAVWFVVMLLTADRCNPVNVTSHATPDTTNTSWYSNITYSCHPGYEWPSPNSIRRIMCRPGGTWSASFGDSEDCKSTLSSCVFLN